MMIVRRGYFIFAFVLMLPLLGCSTNDGAPFNVDGAEQLTDTKPVIAATNGAIQSMTQAIVGDFADVICPQVQANPTGGLNMEEVIRLQKADIVFTNGPGADDAAWLNLISLNQSLVHETTSDEFELSDFIQVEDYRTVHSHGDEGEHSHPWLVPHCWLDPRLGQSQSLSILNRLIDSFPDQESSFRSNHGALVDELETVGELAVELAQLLESKNIKVIASDPRLLFFTRSMKLEDNYFLWFELPNVSVADAELRKRNPEEKENLLVLWAQDCSSLRNQLKKVTGATMVAVSLIEEAGDENAALSEYVVALRRNYQTVKAVVEGMTH